MVSIPSYHIDLSHLCEMCVLPFHKHLLLHIDDTTSHFNKLQKHWRKPFECLQKIPPQKKSPLHLIQICMFAKCSASIRDTKIILLNQEYQQNQPFHPLPPHFPSTCTQLVSLWPTICKTHTGLGEGWSVSSVTAIVHFTINTHLLC